MKSLMPLHTEPVDAKAFLEGKQPWSMLAIPFGGPIPSPKSPRGVDLDGQWFSERTDIYGGYAALKATRERVVDWHHSLQPVNGRGGDPMRLMNGVVLGKAVLRDEADESGWWADFWVTAGEKKRQLLDRLVERATNLYASAQPVVSGKADPETGEILEYPMWAVTITTAPQNHLAIVTPKALLDGADSYELSPGLRSLLTEFSALGAELPVSLPSGGDVAVKAGGESLDRISGGLSQLAGDLDAWPDSIRAALGQEPQPTDKEFPK